MKLNLEKNFKSLLKKKVSFTMAALTIFAITGAVSFADPATTDPNAKIKELETRVGANADGIATLGTRANKLEEFSKAQAILNEKYDQAVDNVGTKADKDGNNIDVDKYKEKLGLDKLEDRLDTQKARIKGLTQNKVNKDDYEQDKKEITKKIDKEIKDRQDHSKIFNKRFEKNEETINKHDETINKHDEKINSLTKDVDELLENAVNGEYVKREVGKEAAARKAADKKHDEAIADNKRSIVDVEDATRSNSEAINGLQGKDMEHDKAIADNKQAIGENKDAIQSEIVDRAKAVLAEENARKAADKAHDKGIADNKKAIDNEAATREAADKKHDAAIAENKAAIKKYDTAIDTNKKAIADEVKRSTEVDARHDAAIAANKAGIEANASDIKHLDSKLNKTTAMMTAMNNVDFQDVNAGEVAIGAGVGHFVGSQAVAVGVAYGVNDDLKVHAKLSGVAGDAHYNAIGGGVTYKFRTR